MVAHSLLPTRAEVTIIGGGIAGVSLALQLSKVYNLENSRGSTIVVLEQGVPGGGASARAPGLVGQLRSSVALTRLVASSVELYRQVAAKDVDVKNDPMTAEATSLPNSVFRGVGSIRVASSEARWKEMQSQKKILDAARVQAFLLSPEETLEKFPLLTTASIVGGLWIPEDGTAEGFALVQAMKRQAAELGVQFYCHSDGAKVVNIRTRPGCAEESARGTVASVTGVETENGVIWSNCICVAAGAWSGTLLEPLRYGRRLPLVPINIQAGITPRLSSLRPPCRELPNLRDPDLNLYARQRGDTLIVGGAEAKIPIVSETELRAKGQHWSNPFDAERFEHVSASLRRCLARPTNIDSQRAVATPSTLSLQRGTSGVEAFVSDGLPIVGPCPWVQGLWVLCGMNGHGFSLSGGLAGAMARWMVEGVQPTDLKGLGWERCGFGDRDSDHEDVRRLFAGYYDIKSVHGTTRSKL